VSLSILQALQGYDGVLDCIELETEQTKGQQKRPLEAIENLSRAVRSQRTPAGKEEPYNDDGSQFPDSRVHVASGDAKM